MTSKANFELQQSDAVAYLRTLPAESVDSLVTDPAYESLEKHRAVGTTTRLKVSAGSSNTWFSIFPNARFGELFAEVHRVLKRDTHFYLMCDPETAFIAKPLAEEAGFKFWKPLVWDKCLAPQTPVRSDRGVIAVKDINPGDRVYTPDGRLVSVLATRATKAPALRIALSTGVILTASEEHRFQLADGTLAVAKALRAGTTLAQGVSGLREEVRELRLEELLEDDERVLELPDPSACLFCGRVFDSSRAAGAHQARFCEKARSKESMAGELGIAPKRLRRWLNTGRLPVSWAQQLGLTELSTGRAQLRLQNDMGRWFEPSTTLDYGWGKLIGLFAAEGWRSELDVVFALHTDEKHLQNHILRMARSLGIGGSVVPRPGSGVSVHVYSKAFSKLVGHFVGGTDARTKHLLPSVFAAPAEFRRGVFDGLIEGDGHWSRDEQRETVNLASLDLASFVLRQARSLGWEATMRRKENDHAGYWCVRFDPAKKAQPITVVSVETVGETELVDIAIDDAAQLYELHDGTVTHNCSIGMGYHYRARYEFVLFFEKGKRRLADLGIADVLGFAADVESGHGALLHLEGGFHGFDLAVEFAIAVALFHVQAVQAGEEIELFALARLVEFGIFDVGDELIDLHIGGDNTLIGGGAFPDDYPNKTTPLPATVHIPNVLLALDAVNGEVPDPTHPDFVEIVLGLDNALAFNLTSLIEAVTASKSPIVVNPTVYGHGYFFNDLALEGTVPYHEGMHAITSPIAGLEGEEGSALNEGQADMWAFTITDNASLGDYVVNAKGFRQLFRDNGRDPDSIAYIRSARSTLKYSDYGTFGANGQAEEHRDGEIYMSTMWDIREMMNRVYPDTTFKRPRAKDGLPQKEITRGTNIFERDFLGSMYILGTTSPDTMVKARDAFIVADQMLYPSDATDPDAPGKHRAMIEQIFAAKELGINAREVSGGQATISTQVSHFAGDQAAPAVPQNVKVAPSSAQSVTVTWDAVPGAVAYEVLKRKIAFAGQREPNGKRVFADGDASTTGYRHAFFTAGDQTSWKDEGPIFEIFAPTGLKDVFDSEYVVRAIGVNSTGQLG